MRTIPKTPSISDEGLEAYLNRTAADHNGNGFDDFVRLVSASVDKANLAKAFGVSRYTIYKWLELFNKEIGVKP